MAEETKQKYDEKIIRIRSRDIPGNMAIYPGLTRITGISWAVSNAICKIMKLDKKQKVGSLNEKEIAAISDFVDKMDILGYLKNRKRDPETGEDTHLIGINLELRKDFDIKRLRKIKSYRGIRLGAGLPTRGQRTRSHFRKNKGKAGIKKKVKKKEE